MKKTIIPLFLLAFLVPSVSFGAFDASLKYGSRGSAVEELQDFLQDQGYLTGKIDGKFGLGTRKAVIAWQKENGLSADGYFGAQSRLLASQQLTEELKPSLEAEQAETGTVSAPLLDGCKSTDGYSITTGKKCDGTFTATQVNDNTTQAKLDALTEQLNKIVQNTTPVVTPTPTQPTVVVPTPQIEYPKVTLNVAKSSEFTDKILVAGSTNVKIASFLLTNNNPMNLRVTNVGIGFNGCSSSCAQKFFDGIANLHLNYRTDYIFNKSTYTGNLIPLEVNLKGGESKIVDVFADISDTYSGTFNTTIDMSGVDAGGITFNIDSAIGQIITVQ